MRHLFLVLPVLALSACGLTEIQNLPDSYTTPGYTGQSSAGYYGGCGGGACAPSQSYAAQGYANQGYINQGYSAPQHINPAGHGPQHGYHAQGYGPQYGRAHGLALRGPRPHTYGTLGVVAYDADADIYGLEGRVGYDTGRVFGAELEGSLGLNRQTDTLLTTSTASLDAKSKIDYNVAAFAVARYPVTPRLSLHSRAGYDFRKFSTELNDGVDSASGDLDLDGFAYGFGAEYALSPRDGLRLDVTRYDNDIGALDSVSASYVRKF